jgi:hypothetical protein
MNVVHVWLLMCTVAWNHSVPISAHTSKAACEAAATESAIWANQHPGLDGK